ncbi:hypothetical protein FZI85_16385 [Mycobacterium sp. CBMA293]|uniref:hypothetical protein n=1 Tax=unclassified Mycolicibacterium TaxID=2636767 RepID=UPI0012DF4E8E|nr:MULTISPECIES: hypothetical protein [unclassified Mycolicibacterium]MUL49451.1 hypothetical protein [Mycolicibacterium sp. CBMA 360]MUL57230.1 hypothetical protein [Mycolicibacterium sp. CBMA 335]MUL70270.1 hypothetical protein [Mycolicibacterium sp. CBMA 311]MUL92318.1 hypothetical protein [Mycolicibacterium sp. CBMA 230]MUM12599.1 hypothetical protein [Mycolicibacterium sp. CBMA 293]
MQNPGPTADHAGDRHRYAVATRSLAPIQARSRGKARMAAAVVVTSAVSLSVAAAPSAVADPVAGLSAAVANYRAGSSCAPLRRDPIADRVAEVINKSISDWLDHTAVQAPISDPAPGLKELGYKGGKSRLLAGTSRKAEADSVKGVLVEGYDAINDCSYTDVGYNMLVNKKTGNVLSAAVLAGS